MLEILKRSWFFFVWGGGGEGCMCKKKFWLCMCYKIIWYLLQLFSPPLSFAILYVLQKIMFAIIFCFTCLCLSYHPTVISFLYIGRTDGFVYVQLLNIVVLQPKFYKKMFSLYHENQIKKISWPLLFIRKLKTCFKFLLDQGTSKCFLTIIVTWL